MTRVVAVRRKTAAAASADLPDRIERVATEMFIRHGYHGVSYLNIAKALGITHSNVHYYYRTKPALAEAVLKRVAEDTLAVTTQIWRGEGTLAEKFVQMRDWIYTSYLRFNPGGRGGRPWGLLSRFSMDADALTPSMKALIRSTLKRLEADVRHAVELAVQRKELVATSPVDGITLQILSVMQLTGQFTRYAAGFERLDELLKWTVTMIDKAYASRRRALHWPPPRATVELEPLAA